MNNNNNNLITYVIMHSYSYVLYIIVHHMFYFDQTELVKLQICFLKILLNDDDQTDTKVSSRILFCRRFQGFVQENMIFWRVKFCITYNIFM